MPICVAADCPSQTSSSSTTMRSPVAAAGAAPAAGTTAVSPKPSGLRGAPGPPANIPRPSERRPPLASDSDRRCLATSKLLIGTMASVRMACAATLTAEACGVVERLLREAPAAGGVGHQRVRDERREALGGLVGHEDVDHI